MHSCYINMLQVKVCLKVEAQVIIIIVILNLMFESI